MFYDGEDGYMKTITVHDDVILRRCLQICDYQNYVNNIINVK